MRRWLLAIVVLGAVGAFAPATAAAGVDASALKHDTFDGYYRTPFGAVRSATPVTLRLRTAAGNASAVTLRVYKYDPATDSTTSFDYPMAFYARRLEGGTTYDVWSATLPTPGRPAILYYKFAVESGSDLVWYSDDYRADYDNILQGGTGVASKDEPFESFQLTVYDPRFRTPAWLQSANVYEIFVDRFRNGDPSNDPCRPGGTSGCPTFYGSTPATLHPTWNERMEDARVTGVWNRDFYGGDLKGIQDKLGYLQSLGIDALWLTPIFKARSNHRYDTDNYLEVDPALGGDAALASLVAAMQSRGMHLILDGVFNHTSSDSLYFDRYHRYPSDGACESLSSPYRSWYEFLTDTVPCGSSDYVSWAGLDSLPVLNHDNPAVRSFIFGDPANSVIKHWFDRGADGWRLDVVDQMSPNWWRDFRAHSKSYSANAPLIGELWADASQFLLGDQLDSAMNYRFRWNIAGFVRTQDWYDDNFQYIPPTSPSEFDAALRAVREDYPPQASAALLNLLDSHDTNRALFLYTQDGDQSLAPAKQRLRLAALFQFSYLGAPTVYYGDEGAINAPSLYSGDNGPEHDPYNRAPYPWPDASGDPTIYGPADGAMVAYYTKLARLRAEHPALRTGAFRTLLTGDTSPSTTDDDVYAFARTSNAERPIAVVLNKGSESETAIVPVRGIYPNATVLDDALAGSRYTVRSGGITLTLAPRSGVLLVPR